MSNSSVLLSNLKREVLHLEEIRAKIENSPAPDMGKEIHQLDLRAYEDLLAAQLVTAAMLYQSTVRWEGRRNLRGDNPTFTGWKRRVSLVLSGVNGNTGSD